jgi:hypothetical protein
MVSGMCEAGRLVTVQLRNWFKGLCRKTGQRARRFVSFRACRPEKDVCSGVIWKGTVADPHRVAWLVAVTETPGTNAPEASAMGAADAWNFAQTQVGCIKARQSKKAQT